ncbi:MAG: DNA mismatch repair endonuclease MutL, partial [Akkermansia sp.]
MEQSQQSIQLMDNVLASQVAAGEVVERPASVIKELVENSIDAGARTIRVEIQRGGSLLMRVTDDGCGMSRQDASMSLLRHATSKLRSFEDLFNIQQMGFRGEAIPSIASVSHFSILTRREQDIEGTLLRVDAGIAQEPQSAGCARGTVIEVRELFYNTPVRRKFLKSAETEAAHIQHQVSLHALCYPQIRFVLTIDGTNELDTAATKDLRQRIAELKGRDIAQKLIQMSPGEAPGVSVSGYLMPLAEAKRNRKMQYIFLNGRPIEDKMVLRAVRDGYGGLPTGLHPALFLYLQVEPGLVDINVHPAKKEVRFRRIADVCTAIMDAIAASLRNYAKQQQTSSSTPPTLGIPQPRHQANTASPTPAAAPVAPASSALRLRPLHPSEREHQQQLPIQAPYPVPAAQPISPKKTHHPIPQDSIDSRETEL